MVADPISADPISAVTKSFVISDPTPFLVPIDEF
jgi:hypothetical protein